MSITMGERVSPRSLVSPELFDKLSEYVSRHHEVTAPYAERMVCQLLVWFQAVKNNPTIRLAMPEAVDPAWHAFILHSQEYSAFCDEMFGRYLHHVPPAPGTSADTSEISRTLPALHATGFPVDGEFWAGRTPCCPPNPCQVKIQDKCSGTGAPPPVSA